MRSKFILNLITVVFLFFAFLFCTSCGSYKQNIMFQVEEDFDVEAMNKASWDIEMGYVIQKGDLLSVEVFTNNGERLIDPNLELAKELAGNQGILRPELKYLVKEGGEVELPQVGKVNLLGMTLPEANELLAEKFSAYYKDPFVWLSYLNKRVVILGSVGGQVIPLENENTSLIEILARAEGIDNNAKAHNIRLLRGEEVFVVDLSTIEGMKKTNLVVQPGDIVYVEPIRRPISESIREYGPVISVITSLIAIVTVLLN